MAQISESVIPSARAASDASSTGGTAQTTFFCVVSRAIVAACDSSAYTCTASISGITSTDLQALLEQLHLAGYTTSIATTTLTVSW